MEQKLRYQQLADAITVVAKVNHYMVGLTDVTLRTVRDDEIKLARVVLINRQNMTKLNSRSWKTYERTLDLFDMLFAKRAA